MPVRSENKADGTGPAATVELGKACHRSGTPAKDETETSIVKLRCQKQHRGRN